MFTIVKATPAHLELLVALGQQTFLESHGHSAAQADIDFYLAEKYTPAAILEELREPANLYHLLYYQGKPAGFSKIVLNSGHANIALPAVTKLERIYILQEFYAVKAGQELFTFNLELSKANGQKGMWLFTWKENHRAIRFYQKNGFQIIGSYDFQISPTHANPNHQMLLVYESGGSNR
ncbi:MAG: GNAT family N-acetyltransferase [Rufibacter sp.]